MSMPQQHAFLAPSAAARWGAQCPGSPKLEATATSYEHPGHAEARRWGDAAHWLAGCIFKGEDTAAGVAPNGVVVDEEMTEAVDSYIADVHAQLKAVGAEWSGGYPPDNLHIEERVDCHMIHADNWGTPDAWHFTPRGAGGLLLIWDAKFGHRFVDAFLNWQMIDYVSGILSRPEFRNLDHAQVHVVMTVVQPRNYHPAGPVRRWQTTALQLAGYWQDLREAASEAMSDNPPTRVGPECGDCKGRHACPALHLAADRAADIAGDAVPMQLPPMALGVELRMLRRQALLLNARVTGLEAQALADIRAGRSVPFFALEQGNGREQWTVDVDTLKTMLGDTAVTDKPLTPAQARKALGASMVPIIDAMATRPPGPFKLTDVQGDKAARVFTANPTPEIP